MAKLPPIVAVGSAMTAALVATILMFAPRSPAGAAGTCDTGSAALDAAELAMVQLHNDTRAKQGLPALKVSPGLSRTAAWKAADSSGAGPTFGHTDSLGRGPSQRAADCGFPGEAAENIAFGYASAAATFD